MQKKNKIFGKVGIMLLIAGMTFNASSAFAQLQWSGVKKFTKSEDITQDITLTGQVSLILDPDVTVNFKGAIHGAAKYNMSVSVSKATGGCRVYLYGKTTFTGTLDIYTRCDVWVKSASPLTANVKVNGTGQIIFDQTGNQTYGGIISGFGDVRKLGKNTLTLTKSSTHTGNVYIEGGTLALGTSGNIATSVCITMSANTTLDISATSKLIKGLQSEHATASVILGDRILTVSNPKDCTFAGVISGKGGIAKKSNGTLYLTGKNTYTGATQIFTGKILYKK